MEPVSSGSTTRKKVFLLLIGIIVLGAAALVLVRHGGWPIHHAIPPEQVDFPGMQLQPAGNPFSFTLVGRARNRSEQTVNEVLLLVTMEDVTADGKAAVVAKAEVLLRHQIPSKESWSFREPVAFEHYGPAKGRHEWNYTVTEVR